MGHSKSFSRVKSTQNKKVHFIKGIELKLIQVELLSVFLILHVQTFSEKAMFHQQQISKENKVQSKLLYISGKRILNKT